jgi:RHS repeat-associated protein
MTRTRHMLMRMAVVALSMTVAATTVVVPVATAGAPDRTARKPALQEEKSVPGTPATLRSTPTVEMPGHTPATVVWPGRHQVEIDAAMEQRRAGDLPVAVSGEAGSRLKVETFEQDLAAKAGVAGVLLKVSDVSGKAGQRVSVRLDYAGFAGAFGGDYASRLQLLKMPDCVLSTPDKPECRKGTPVETDNNMSARQLSTRSGVDQPAGGVVLAVAAAPAGPGGSFKETSLAPAGSWSAGGSSGDFGYSYPLRVPESLGGVAPQMSLGYSSGAVDGRTSATNNQASMVGDGWDLGLGGYIERRYKSCAEDPSPGTGQANTADQCWATDNATIQLAGVSAELVKDPVSGIWRAKNDDGSRIERLHGAASTTWEGDNDGEYWRVTTPDGTKYYLGYRWQQAKSTWTVPVYGNHPNEPCKQTTFAASWCWQAWRWNLDYVEDPRGNVTTFYYTPETNNYGRNLTANAPTRYVRAGHAHRIEYGLRVGNVDAPAPMRVLFETSERCLPGGTVTCDPGQLNSGTAKSWPDTPFDQICADGALCDNQFSPTFFTRKRLTRVVTQVRDDKVATPAWRDVDSWSFRHSFPDTGDGLSPALWLNGITHAGHVNGTLALPETVFTGISRANRVDAKDDRPPITRFRMERIRHEAGGITQIEYTQPDCVAGVRMPANPEHNTMRCYPTWWTPVGGVKPVFDWFQKYVVSKIVEDDLVQDSATQNKTYYEYPEGAAWHFDDNDWAKHEERTWSAWRGYGKVRTIKGDPGAPNRTVTESLYLRGMDGDRLPIGTKDVWVSDVAVPGVENGRVEDVERLQGFQRQTVQYDGATLVSSSVNDPWLSAPTAVNGEDKAQLLNTASVRGHTIKDGGGWRRTQASTRFNERGLAIEVNDPGDLDVSNDEKCTLTEYVPNDAAGMFSFAKRVQTYANVCSTPSTPESMISDSRSHYDNKPYGEAPTRGLVTAAERWTGTEYQVVTRTAYDTYGRAVEVTDAANAKTTTSFVPATDHPVRTVSTTNPLGHVSTVAYEPTIGQPITQTGPNGEHTDADYDPLGRLSKTWLHGRSRTSSPSSEHSYTYDVAKATVVAATKQLRDDNLYNTSYKLYDGLMRPRQTQTPAVAGGRVLTDTWYDSRGLAWKTNAAYYNDQSPTPVVFVVLDNNIPNQTRTEFDKLERPTKVTYHKLAIPQWSTTTTYSGERTTVVPPAGDKTTAVIKNVQGQVTERRQHRTGPADFDSTRYQYNLKGQLELVTDPAGNKWSYEYDKLNRKFKDVDPDKGTTTYHYNNLDQLEKSTDARGKSLVHRYDVLGRKTETFEESFSGIKLAEWKYDTLKKGLPTSSTRFADGQAYIQRITEYDAQSRVKGTETEIPAVEGKLGRKYPYSTWYTPNTSMVESVVSPAAGGLEAERVITSYNEMGAPTKTLGYDYYVGDHEYSKYGETLRLTLGEQQMNLTNYYEEGTRRLERAIADRATATDYRVADRSYTYDPAGNIKRIADQPSSGGADVQCFNYDYLRRLTQAFTPNTGNCAPAPTVPSLGGAAPYWFDFGYDNVGNRRTETKHTAQGDTTRTYNYPAGGAPQPHTVRSIEQTGPNGTSRDEFDYNPNGDTVSRKVSGSTQTLDWDSEGHLSLVTEADGKKSSYVYDASGARLLKREPGRTTLYLPEGMELVLDTTGNTVAGKRYYKYGGATVAVRYSGSGGVSYLLSDHQGTATATVNTANLSYRRRYSDPFGNARGPAPATWPDDKGFVGGTKDTTGLTHVGAREYDPSAGRFLSVDPVMDLADSQQINGYSYSNNSPVTFSDPSGLWLEGGDDGMGGTYGHDPSNNNLIGIWPDDAGGELLNKSQARKKRKYNEERRRWARFKARAASDAGMIVDKYEEYKRTAGIQKTWWDVVVETVPDVLGDLSGYNDIRDCFTKGDVWACVGLIPWSKAWKIAKNVGKIISAFRAASRLMDEIAFARRQVDKVDDAAEDIVRGCNSFVPGTLVRMADGNNKPIEQVQLGDQVLATDPKTGLSAARQVVATITGDGQKNLVQLTIDTDGSAGNQSGTITATEGHPFWAPQLKTWVKATDLVPGSWLLTAAGTWIQVTATGKWTTTQSVLNLTIDNTHTYYVVAGGPSVLNHNNSSCPIDKSDTLLPGENAREGVALVDGDIEAPGVRELVNEAGNRHGCHSCPAKESGLKSGAWIPDHQPPTKLTPGGPQTAYPHCVRCARRQGGQVNGINREWTDEGP